MSFRIVLAAVACLLISANAAAREAFPREFSAKVIRVPDGDTLRVRLPDGALESVRLTAVDAPESDQPFGEIATKFVESAVLDQVVLVRAFARDRYGRLLSDVTTPSGVDLSRELLKAGLAWWFYQFSDDLELASLEIESKVNRRGLFSADAPIDPRAWRRGARIRENGGVTNGTSNSGAMAEVTILAALPNPAGLDAGNETVILGNQANADRDLIGWALLDDNGGHYSLDGTTVRAGGALTVDLDESLRLGNGGGRIMLRNATGQIVATLQYDQAPMGRFVGK
jgi:endonuclease YncB( thermonuclease family)